MCMCVEKKRTRTIDDDLETIEEKPLSSDAAVGTRLS